MCQLFESILFTDGQFHNLDIHQARVNKTFKNVFPGHLPISLTLLIRDIKPTNGVFKCRISYNKKSGSVNLQPYQKNPPSTLKVVTNNSIEYDFKYENRTELDQLYELRSGKDDVLIVRNQLITDTSFGNICLSKNGQWYTPSQPLLSGTQREFLIGENIVFEKTIYLDDLFSYDHFMVINAMLPFDVKRAEPIHQIEI